MNERVKYTDATDDSDVHDKRGSHDHGDDDRHQDTDSHSKSKRDATLTNAITTAGSSLVSRVANKTQTIQRSYHSTESKTASGGGASVDSNSAHNVTDKTGANGDTHIDAQRSKTTHLQYDVSKTVKYLRPQLDVRVTEGDGEVASTAFSAKPGHEGP